MLVLSVSHDSYRTMITLSEMNRNCDFCMGYRRMVIGI